MTCVNPYVVSIGLAFGCGRCFYCRRQKAKVWTHRIILEAAQHKDNSFLTLTYNDDNIPKGGSLDPRHLQLFFKRLRKRIEPNKIRFFAVGEYGDTTRRPHYHAALFGYPPCNAPIVPRGTRCVCSSCNCIASCWTLPNGVSLGFISVGTLEPASAGYVAAYATKSMEKGDADITWPTGCVPPFSRQSNRPGIGAGVCDDIASTLLQHDFTELRDIPTHLSHGTDRRPLGRYLRNRIRARVGITKDEATYYGIKKLEEKLQPMREIALMAEAGKRSFAFREVLVQSTENRRLQIDRRYSIMKQRRKL